MPLNKEIVCYNSVFTNIINNELKAYDFRDSCEKVKTYKDLAKKEYCNNSELDNFVFQATCVSPVENEFISNQLVFYNVYYDKKNNSFKSRIPNEHCSILLLHSKKPLEKVEKSSDIISCTLFCGLNYNMLQNVSRFDFYQNLQYAKCKHVYENKESKIAAFSLLNKNFEKSETDNTKILLSDFLFEKNSVEKKHKQQKKCCGLFCFGRKKSKIEKDIFPVTFVSEKDLYSECNSPTANFECLSLSLSSDSTDGNVLSVQQKTNENNLKPLHQYKDQNLNTGKHNKEKKQYTKRQLVKKGKYQINIQ